jgi:deoxyribodipyrimidine photo-lyase
MLQSLHALDNEVRNANGIINYYYGQSEAIISDLMENQGGFDAVYLNRDYTPFSRKRDAEVRKTCQKHGATLYLYGDSLINEPDSPSTLKKDGHPYTVFTPFYKNALKIPVEYPKDHKYVHLTTTPEKFKNQYNRLTIEEIINKILPADQLNPHLVHLGGRPDALNILQNLEQFINYTVEHDVPSLHGTSRLAPHLKFGTCSIREAYHTIRSTLGQDHPILRQLYWREFFTQVAYHFPKVFGNSFQEKFNQIQWNENEKLFQAWCTGHTGFPIVDAGMRELNTTGFMHNRVRMITASFLTKDLHIDWRKGEQYFAQKLTDYDPAVNNGNWQWAASTGCDATPYFRIFNPWIQQQKFDPESAYIKNWIPELSEQTPKTIHHLYKSPLSESSYPKQIVTHENEAKFAIVMYRSQENGRIK